MKTIIQEITQQAEEQNLGIKEILKLLFADDKLKEIFANEIRRSTMIGNITNEILSKQGKDERCEILAIGDIKYYGELEQKWATLVENSLQNIKATDLVGYDLVSQGSPEFRQKIVDYMGIYYNLNQLTDFAKDEIIPTYGGTDGFVNLLETIKEGNPDQNIKFIYPEASFVVNAILAEKILGKENVIKVNKPNPKEFFMQKQQIEDLKLNPEDINIFYITPVGNPTGSSVGKENLYQMLDYISDEENNIVILDNVYVGLLENENSSMMFQKIFANEKIMDSIIFAESLSKTLGTTGIRVGWLWTINQELSNQLKSSIILRKAGFSKVLNEFTTNLLSDIDQIKEFQNEVYNFWNEQRMTFMKKIEENYAHLFDLENSAEVLNREGIYAFLKVRDGYSVEDIFAESGIIGVGIPLSDGMYVRYAFANVR